MFDLFWQLALERNKSAFGFDIESVENIQYGVYNENDKYDWHIDAHKMGSAADIKLTCLLNLSEETYEGGEFNSMNQKEKKQFDILIILLGLSLYTVKKIEL